MLTTALAVAAMTVAGVALCLVAHLGRGIKTTMLLHWATNSLGFLAAWLVLNRPEPPPASQGFREGRREWRAWLPQARNLTRSKPAVVTRNQWSG